MRGRAYARHHDLRRKKKVRRYEVCVDYDYALVPDPRYGQRQVRIRGPYPTEDPQRIGSMSRTPKPCSCWSCGNPRRHFGQRTVQERRWGWR